MESKLASIENQVTVIWNQLKLDWKSIESKLKSIENQVAVNWNQVKVIWN